MTFVLRMALRETRASWRRLLFFFVCIAVGVAAIVALRSVIQSVRAVFGQEAKSLIAADVLISTNRDWTPAALATIDRRLSTYGATARTETIETPTMVRPADERPVARMVELRAVQAAFPLYGELTLDGGQAYSHALVEQHGVLVRPELLSALGVAVGDRIVIGLVPFTIRGVIANEPGRRVGDFSLGPRVIVDFADLPSTGLLSLGSRARRVLLARVPDDRIAPLVEALHGDFKDDFVSARSYRSNDDEIGADFDRAENYLSLVGLIIVILGGISVSSVTRVFVLQKMRSIAVLKCLGARSAQIISVYMLQVLVLGLAGSVLGVGLARAAVAVIPYAIDSGAATSLLSEVHYGVTWSAAVQGMAVGVLVSLLFSVVPLLHVRLVKPSMLLRDESSTRGIDWTRVAAIVVVSAALVAVTAWQAASLRAGLVVCGGFLILAVVLLGAAQALVGAVAPLARTRFVCAAARRSARVAPGQPDARDPARRRTRRIFHRRRAIAAGEPACAVLDRVGARCAGHVPDGHPAGPVERRPRISRGSRERRRRVPDDSGAARAGHRRVSGHDASMESYEDVRARGSLAREYTVTYRDHLESNETVVAGAFWDGASPDPEVSVEEGLHERFKINLGDTVRFDILGRAISARVTSIRDVDWKDSRAGGFMFVFRPGVLEQAPQTFIAPLRGPLTIEARARFQHDLVRTIPERVGDRFSRDPGNGARRDVESHARHHGRRRARAVRAAR